VFREVSSHLLRSAAMEGTVGRRGCKPGVAMGGEMRAMLDMALRAHPFCGLGCIVRSSL
jgi:hypothetical protein